MRCRHCKKNCYSYYFCEFTEVNIKCFQIRTALCPTPATYAVFTYLCPKKFSERPVTGCMLGRSHFPFCSQVPCWILKDYMMMKCALQITYRSMQLLILPHALSDSLKSQLIACYLTFHKLRGVSRTVKNKLFFTQGVLGQR